MYYLSTKWNQRILAAHKVSNLYNIECKQTLTKLAFCSCLFCFVCLFVCIFSGSYMTNLTIFFGGRLTRLEERNIYRNTAILTVFISF